MAGTRAWWRNSYGGITDGQWTIYRDAADTLADEGNAGRPWSLWREGEYVGNYATVAAAKDDAHLVDDDAPAESTAYPSADILERAGIDPSGRGGMVSWETLARHLLERDA
jgi:hypothetical protein